MRLASQKIRRCALGVLIAVPLFFSQGAQLQASIIQFDGSGAVTDILDLQVNASLFLNIEFVTTSFNTAFPGGPFPAEVFGTFAWDIVDAIVIELIAAGNPFITGSGSSDSGRRFGIPHGFDLAGSGNIFAFQAFCFPMSFSAPNCGTLLRPDWISSGGFIISPDGITSWAVPTLAATSVPEPTSLALISLGLLVLGFGRSKRLQ